MELKLLIDKINEARKMLVYMEQNFTKVGTLFITINDISVDAMKRYCVENSGVILHSPASLGLSHYSILLKTPFGSININSVNAYVKQNAPEKQQVNSGAIK